MEIVIIEFPFVVKCSYASASTPLTLSDNTSQFSIDLLQIPDVISKKNINEKLIVVDGKYRWLNSSYNLTDPQLYKFRYYAVVAFGRELSINYLISYVYERSELVGALKNTTIVEPKMHNLSPYSSMSVFEKLPVEIVWHEEFRFYSDSLNNYVRVISKVPALSNPLKLLTPVYKLPLIGLPICYVDFMRRHERHLYCRMTQHQQYNMVAYKIAYTKSVECGCFEQIYKMPTSLTRIGESKYMHVDCRGLHYYIICPNYDSELLINNSDKELVSAINNTTRCDSILKIFHDFGFDDITILPHGLWAKDHHSNVMYTGLVPDVHFKW